MPVPLRSDFDASQLRAVARRTKDAPQARRLLALAAIYDGASRTEAARIGGVTLQIVRDWVVKFNGHGPQGLVDRKSTGKPSRLNDAHRAVERHRARAAARDGEVVGHGRGERQSRAVPVAAIATLMAACASTTLPAVVGVNRVQSMWAPASPIGTYASQ